MAEETKTVELKTNDETHTLRFDTIETFRDGSGYSCVLAVHSGGFSCRRPFWFDDFHLGKAIESLRHMDAGRSGEAVIGGATESDCVKITVDEKGHVFVTGEIFEHAALSQSLKFGFRTDQTVLRPLLRDLDALAEL